VHCSGQLANLAEFNLNTEIGSLTEDLTHLRYQNVGLLRYSEPAKHVLHFIRRVLIIDSEQL
jgi:hypothetical protein